MGIPSKVIFNAKLHSIVEVKLIEACQLAVLQFSEGRSQWPTFTADNLKCYTGTEQSNGVNFRKRR